MILFKINAKRIALKKFKREAPWPIHMNRIAGRIKAAQGMEIKPRQIHFVRTGTGVQPVEPEQNPAMEPFVNPGRAPR
jgi:hypothetical protein